MKEVSGTEEDETAKEMEARKVEERQRVKEAEACEAERQTQREVWSKCEEWCDFQRPFWQEEQEKQLQREQRERQQAQALLLTLHELQRTMNPLVAAQTYNSRFCPLTSRLPEELLLCILDFLSDDVVALQCLRLVSRTFFRLLSRGSVIWSERRDIPLYIRRNASWLPESEKVQFRRLLQRDGRCDNCKRWNEAHQHSSSDDCKFQQRFRRGSRRVLYCNACDSPHDMCQFSSTNQQPSQNGPGRRCLGQEGSVRLCEHIQITWDTIKTHIEDWRRQQPRGEWKACLRSFNIECHDKIHDTRCTDSEVSTWPRARLSTSTSFPSRVVLNLEWTPHSRIDALALARDGRIPAVELEALFQRLRNLGPADHLYPSWRLGSLPETIFFSASSRIADWVYYEAGEDNIGPTRAWFPPLPWQFWQLSNNHGRGENGRKLHIRPHFPKGLSGSGLSSQCLIISYAKDIMICDTSAITDPAIKIIPTDHWLHAIDTQAYPHPQATHIRPQCRDTSCFNYYQRRCDYYICSTWSYVDKR